MEKNAQEIFDLLNNSIIDKVGRIVFSLGEISVTIDTTDTVGNSLQRWLKEWLIKNDIYEHEPENTQEFPDFYLSASNPKDHMLEVKAFNYNATPAFDIANYESYIASVAEKPYRLAADYIILGYVMDNDGTITIKKIWLKKIWEIAGKSKKRALKVQEKKNVIYNIRPNSEFKREKPVPFANKEAFLKAMYETQKEYRGEDSANTWKSKLQESYLKYYHEELVF